MPPKAASESDIARGKRLEKWLEQVAPAVKASYRGMVVLEEPRQTVNNWLKGSKISNDGICKIIEAGGYGALAFILGTKPYISNAKTTHEPDEVLIHGKGVNFWYKQYVREKARTVTKSRIIQNSHRRRRRLLRRRTHMLVSGLQASARLAAENRAPRSMSLREVILHPYDRHIIDEEFSTF